MPDAVGSSPTQVELAGMPQRLLAATPTRLTTWLDCPRRYRMTYLDRPAPPKGPPWAHNTVGAAAHLALRDWFLLPVPRRTPTAAGALAAQHLGSDGFRDDAQRERWRERTAAAVESYAQTLDPELEPVGVERTVAARTEVLALSGRVDRIDERGEELVVVDYKTGRRAPGVEDARGSLALAAYAAAAQRTLRRPCRRVELHHLPSGVVAVWEHSADGLTRQLRRMDAIGAEARDAHDAHRARGGVPDGEDPLFPSRPGPACGWCDLRRCCPAGQAAGPPRRSWDGLGED